jgi:enoyl-CoA hydratase/carnithine racemase
MRTGRPEPDPSEMPNILVTDDGPVRILRMNRPEKKNALTQAMYEALAAAIEEVGRRGETRCLLLAGSPGVFCAGNDINDFFAASQTGALGKPVLHFLHALACCEKPIVAAVAGAAIGIGTTMLLHCDHVVAAADATLATPFAALGLVPEAASSLIAPRLMGQARAFSLLVMGEPLTAEAAKAAGIVNTVVPAAQVDTRALAAARAIAVLPPEGVRVARRLMRGSPDEIVARIDAEAEVIKERLTSPEAQAAFAAFLSRKR